jgi:hypothetical protein
MPTVATLELMVQRSGKVVEPMHLTLVDQGLCSKHTQRVTTY